jgi:hypothetical protein
MRFDMVDGDDEDWVEGGSGGGKIAGEVKSRVSSMACERKVDRMIGGKITSHSRKRRLQSNLEESTQDDGTEQTMARLS